MRYNQAVVLSPSRASHAMKSIVITVLIVLLTSPVLTAQEPKDVTMTIAAWNVKGRPEIDNARAKQIAIGIAYLDAEVIALTEVAPHSIITKIKEELDDLGCPYKVSMPTAGQSELGIAILFKDGVTKVADAEFIEDAQLGPGDARKPVAIELKTGDFDFKIIAVHLKSGSSGRQTRNEQCEKIAEYVETGLAIQDSEKDVLVVGDYNMIPRARGNRDDGSNFSKLNTNGRFNFISRGEMYGDGSHISGGRLGNVLDGFAISSGRTEEYLDGSLRIFPLHKTMRRNLRDFSNEVSDHLPLVAKFDVASSDDD